MADFIPGAEGDQVTWLTNLKTKIAGYATPLNITAARVTQITGWCDALTSKIQSVEQKKNLWLAEAALKETQATTSIGGLRAEVAKWKTEAGMTKAISADLQIAGAGETLDSATHKPKISVESFPGFNRLKFVKGKTDGVTFYWRKKGEAAWKFLSRDTNSPYDDHTALTTPGIPEVREYQAFAMVKDEQIGQPSDIVSATFGG
jgi:hypothetical protein